MVKHLQVAQRVVCTQAEGPGKRYALWLQGCPMRCPECCNPEMLSFDGGEKTLVTKLIDEVLQTAREHNIEGITLLGGEPFAHAEGCVQLADAVRDQNLSVMIFSGYELTELQAMGDSSVARLLNATDLLVDGRYDRAQPDSTRRWVGSSNQRVHFLTDRYSEADAYWSEPDTIEIRMSNGEVLINGFPAQRAKQLWKRTPR